MAFGAADVKRFGGLQLSSDPADVGLESALAATNVELALDRSWVRSRDGLTRLGIANSMSATGVCRLLVDVGTEAGVGYLMAVVRTDTDSRAYVFQSNGTVTLMSTWTLGATAHFDAVNFGTPTANSTFVATDGQPLQRYVAFGMGPSVGSPKYVAVTPTSNRLVQARFASAAGSPTGANGSKSAVFFSDAGAPTTYGANNYVSLDPGDYEEIRGVATWRGQTFVFKETKMFVFYGESTSSTGTPVFDYRQVTLTGRIGQPALPASGPVVGVGDLGVYYLALDGVYRTTGGPPVLVSSPIDELFRTELIQGQFLSAAGSRVAVSTGSAVYILSERTGQWVKWTSAMGGVESIPTAPFATWSNGDAIGDPNTLMWAHNATMYYTDRTATTDNATAISSEYQSGFSDLGSPAIKTVRQSQVWGSGTITHSMGTDYNAPDAGTSLALGAGRDDMLERIARRGTMFSFKLAAASGAWKVDSVSMHLRAPRRVGARP